jgi:hypothetical protein
MCFYSVPARIRVLPEKLTAPHPIKKFPTFYGTLSFIAAFTRARHLSLSCFRLIQSKPPPPPTHYLKTHFNIFLPSAPGSSQWSLSLRFPHQKNPICTSPVSHTCYVPCPSNFLFHQPNNIWWVQIIKFPVCNHLHLYAWYFIIFFLPDRKVKYRCVSSKPGTWQPYS